MLGYDLGFYNGQRRCQLNHLGIDDAATLEGQQGWTAEGGFDRKSSCIIRFIGILFGGHRQELITATHKPILITAENINPAGYFDFVSLRVFAFQGQFMETRAQFEFLTDYALRVCLQLYCLFSTIELKALPIPRRCEQC